MLSHLLRAYFEGRWSKRTTASTMLKVSRMSPPSLFRQSPGHRMGQTVALIGALVSTVKEWNKSNSWRKLIPQDGNCQIFSETVGILSNRGVAVSSILLVHINKRTPFASQTDVLGERARYSISSMFLNKGYCARGKKYKFLFEQIYLRSFDVLGVML